MNELIEKFNNELTHIEIDAINQLENGGKDEWTYTLLLIDNKTKDTINQISISDFGNAEMSHVRRVFELTIFTNAIGKKVSE